MMRKVFALVVLLAGGSALYASDYEEVPVYDYSWEEFDTDYDEICDEAEYEKPSPLKIWLRSVGGALYVSLCSIKEYFTAQWLALQKALWKSRRKAKVRDISQDSSLTGIDVAGEQSATNV